MISVSGGKLTTYRIMARDVVDRVVDEDGETRPCRTGDWPLAGASGWDQVSLEARARELGLASDVAAHLGWSLGSLAAEVLDLAAEHPRLQVRLYETLPTIEAEVLYAARAELGLTVEDVVARRLRLDLEAGDHGLAAAARVAEILAAEYGWSADERARQVADYARYAAERAAGLRPSAARDAGALLPNALCGST
jgi:glycerol-3-phosphate dehydrogenase